MKRIIFTTFGGLVLLALAPVSATARADVHFNFGLGVFGPAPYYVEPPPVYYSPPRYYSPPPPVYYGPTVGYQHRDWDRRDWDRRGWRGGHDRGRHRGHGRHDDN